MSEAAPRMNRDRLADFRAAYLDGLRGAVKADPGGYFYTLPQVPDVVEKMMEAIEERPLSVNYDGAGIRAACRALKIKPTRKAILAFLAGE